MGNRTDLQTLFETLLGSNLVYFQPPSTFQMQYPCIVYNLSDIDTKFADNAPFILKKEYSVTIIDENPDSVLPEALAKLPGCAFSRAFMVDQLNHYVFTIIF